MNLARFALLFVVFLDVMTQGLIIPILNTLVMDPAHGFLPAHTDVATRQFDFGLAMGVFFLAWFLGCLVVYGALFGTGYALYGRSGIAALCGGVAVVAATALFTLLPKIGLR